MSAGWWLLAGLALIAGVQVGRWFYWSLAGGRAGRHRRRRRDDPSIGRFVTTSIVRFVTPAVRRRSDRVTELCRRRRVR